MIAFWHAYADPIVGITLGLMFIGAMYIDRKNNQ